MNNKDKARLPVSGFKPAPPPGLTFKTELFMYKIPFNYYPIENAGITLKYAGKLDPWRMYCNKVQYNVSEIAIYPDFNFKGVYYTHYLLLQVNGVIDYLVLTSLN